MTIFTADKARVPIWVQQKRAPTRAELAAKHFADGGTVGPAEPVVMQDPLTPGFFDDCTAPVVKRFNK